MDHLYSSLYDKQSHLYLENTESFKIYFMAYAITDVPFFLPFIPLYPVPLSHHHFPTLLHVHGSYM